MSSAVPRDMVQSPFTLCSVHGMASLTASQRRSVMCTYRGKLCPNVRARKRNGALHRFCEFHRQRANSNQKRWASRRNLELDRQTLTELELAYQQQTSKPEPPSASSEETHRMSVVPAKSYLQPTVELDDSVLAWLDDWANGEQFLGSDSQTNGLSEGLVLFPFTVTL